MVDTVCSGRNQLAIIASKLMVMLGDFLARMDTVMTAPSHVMVPRTDAGCWEVKHHARWARIARTVAIAQAEADPDLGLHQLPLLNPSPTQLHHKPPPPRLEASIPMTTLTTAMQIPMFVLQAVFPFVLLAIAKLQPTQWVFLTGDKKMQPASLSVVTSLMKQMHMDTTTLW